MKTTKEVAKEIGVSEKQIQNMISNGIPDHFIPKKKKREGAKRKSFAYRDHHIDILNRAFDLKENMTYKEVKKSLSHMLAKECYTCKEVYPLSREYWHYDSSRTDGFDGRCIECKNEYNKSRRIKAKEKGVDNLMDLDDESEIRVGDAAKLLGISRSFLGTILSSAIPNHLKPKKTQYYASGGLAYSFEQKDLRILEKAIKLKTNHTYPEVLEILSQEHPDKIQDEDIDTELITNYREDESPSEELININNEDGRLLASSREIAKNFDKRHNDVVALIDKKAKDLTTQNFTVENYFIKSNFTHNGNVYDKYLLTRDGFSFIVMGFTGAKADLWKLKYIEAFNKMEQALMENRSSYMIDDPVERAKAWIKEQEQREELELKTKQQQQIIGELKPKSDYTDRILKSSDLVTITQISKDYGMSGQAMNTLLHNLEVQYKASGQWLLYKDYQDKGYTHSQTIEYVKANGSIGTNMHTKWTQKGRLFLYDLLKEKEVLPLIER